MEEAGWAIDDRHVNRSEAGSETATAPAHDNAFPQESSSPAGATASDRPEGAVNDLASSRPHAEERARILSLPNVTAGVKVNANELFILIKNLLCTITELEMKLSDFTGYVMKQEASHAYLYEWRDYEGYDAIKQKTEALKGATQGLKNVAIEVDGKPPPHHIVNQLVGFGVTSSISVSRLAHYVLSTMNSRISDCFKEIDQSSFHSDQKAQAQERVIRLASTILCYTSESSGAVYNALDLLLEKFYTAEEGTFGKPTSRNSTRHAKASPTPRRKFATWMLYGLQFLLIPALAYHWLLPNALPSVRIMPESEMANLRTEVANTMLKENELRAYNATILQHGISALRKDVQQMQEQIQDQSLRIDNIWDALGPPNKDGKYDFGASHGPNDAAGFTKEDIARLRKEIDEVYTKCHKEIVELRREIHLKDIRLTSAIRRLEKQK
jgi:hypothetical protein